MDQTTATVQLRLGTAKAKHLDLVSEVGGSLLRHKMVKVDGRWKVCRIVRNREKRR